MGAPRLATVAWVMDWSEKLAPLLLGEFYGIGPGGVGASCFKIGATVGSLIVARGGGCNMNIWLKIMWLCPSSISLSLIFCIPLH